MRKTEALLRAALRARETGHTMYVYRLAVRGNLWSYASAAWINGLGYTPNELTEVQPQ